MNIDKEAFIAYKPYSLSWSVLRKIVFTLASSEDKSRQSRTEILSASKNFFFLIQTIHFNILIAN